VANEVRPYLVPRSGTVSFEPWELLDVDWVELPSEFEGWDTGTDLLIRRTVRMEPERFAQETGLDPAQVVLTTSWISSTTGMKGAATPSPVPKSGLALLEARLPGDGLAGTVAIRTTLCLALVPGTVRTGVARLPGSVLMDHRQSIVLDRGDQLFPVDAIDFAATRLPPAASWHLETSSDLGAPFFGTFRVLVNSRDTELTQAVARGARDKRQQALLDELESGVAALLTETALLLEEEMGEQSDWPDDSVGDVLSRLSAASTAAGLTAPGATNLALFRTKVSAAVRASGKGRQFR
jgi:hypothetical protein